MDNISNLLFIKACTNICEYNKVFELFNLKYINNNISNCNIQFLTCLINCYSVSGNITEALNIFNNMSNNKKDFICEYNYEMVN